MQPFALAFATASHRSPSYLEDWLRLSSSIGGYRRSWPPALFWRSHLSQLQYLLLGGGEHWWLSRSPLHLALEEVCSLSIWPDFIRSISIPALWPRSTRLLSTGVYRCWQHGSLPRRVPTFTALWSDTIWVIRKQTCKSSSTLSLFLFAFLARSKVVHYRFIGPLAAGPIWSESAKDRFDVQRRRPRSGGLSAI